MKKFVRGVLWVLSVVSIDSVCELLLGSCASHLTHESLSLMAASGNTHFVSQSPVSEYGHNVIRDRMIMSHIKLDAPTYTKFFSPVFVLAC